MSLRSSMVNQRLRKPSVCWGSREPLVGPRQALPLLPVPPPSGQGRRHVHSPSAHARGASCGLWDHLGPGIRVPRVCPHPPHGRDLGVHRDMLGGGARAGGRARSWLGLDPEPQVSGARALAKHWEWGGGGAQVSLAGTADTPPPPPPTPGYDLRVRPGHLGFQVRPTLGPVFSM